ncbi:MAG: S8 family serine peptidase [Thiogranum sp.]
MKPASRMLLLASLATVVLPAWAGTLQDMLTASGVRADIADQVALSLMGSDRAGKDGPLSKIGPALALTYQEYRDYAARGGYGTLGKPFKPSNRLVRMVGETVVVDLAANGDATDLKRDLMALGMLDTAVFGHMVSGRLPVKALASAAALGSLRLARPAAAMTRTGSVTSQGDAAMLADSARASFGVDGTGVNVGTLSDSYDCLGGAAADVASGDLPAGVTVLQEESDCGSGSDEGRAMMQIVHDVAPGASQAFHSAFNGQADFANGIIELASVANADIINDDVIYFAEPMFQDGIVAQAVDSVKGMGVAYFSAAGNAARDSYEDSFRDSGVAGYSPGSTRHDFDAGTGTDSLQQVTIAGNTQIIIVLQWDDPYFSVSGSPGADTDMDIILYSKQGVALAGGIANNIGGDPVEIFGYTTPNGPSRQYQIAIEHVSGPLPSRIKYVFYGNMTIDQFATNSATSYGHPAAAGGQAVGAARYDATPAFGVSPPELEYFSSAGGIDILFDTAGNPLSDTRQKPEIVAPDGGDNTFFGGDYEGNGTPNFFGTSAATPHAAGLAALLKQLDPSLSPDALYNTLQTTAIDMGVTGVDADSGHGLVQADLALTSLDGDADGVPNSADNCPAAANPLQENNDGDSQGDVCDPDDDNDTLSDVDEINLYGTDPFLSDTDSDGFDDAVEIAAGSDPLDSGNIPGSASGDINGDGNVDVADLLKGYQFVLGTATPGTNELLRGDVAPLVSGQPEPDGQFTAGDLLVLQRMIVGAGTP